MKNPKMLIIFAYDPEGGLTTDRVSDDTTMNKRYYESYLREILCLAIGLKCPELLSAMQLILHDNVTRHKAAI